MPPVVPPCPNGGNAPPSWLRFLSLPPSLEERKPPLSRPRRFRIASLFCCRLASCSSGRLHSSALAIHGSADTRTSMFIVHVQTTRLSDFLSSRRTRTRRQPNRRIHGKPLVRWKPLVLVEIAARFLLFERVGFVLSSSERHRWPERFQAGFALWSSERHRWPDRFQVGFSLCSSERCKWTLALSVRFVL